MLQKDTEFFDASSKNSDTINFLNSEFIDAFIFDKEKWRYYTWDKQSFEIDSSNEEIKFLSRHFHIGETDFCPFENQKILLNPLRIVSLKSNRKPDENKTEVGFQSGLALVVAESIGTILNNLVHSSIRCCDCKRR